MANERPAVVVVGAGLAGLTCAYRLVQHDVDVIVLEAQGRLGGRCWSARGWRDGQVAEHGGELIEVGQDYIIALAKELGLEMEHRADESGEGWIRIGGQSMPPRAVIGLPQVLKQLSREVGEIGSVRYDNASDAARKLDERSIAEWIEQNVDGGRQGALGRCLESSTTLNLGFDATTVSALMMHTMFSGLPTGDVDSEAFSFGHGDDDEFPEVYQAVRAAVTDVMHVRGGNDSLVTGLAERLQDGVVRMASPLARLSRRPDDRYEVEVAGEPRALVADQVVLACPLPCLRSVDLSGAQLSQRRHDAIAQVPMGRGTKLMLQLVSRPAQIDAWPGFAFTDEPYVAFWDTSAGQPGEAGLLTFFTSGLVFTADEAHAAATSEALAQAKQLLDLTLPGLAGHATQNGWLDSWPDDPWSQGSYSGFAPGQFTRYFGFLNTPEHGVHFAGEHTSMGSQGYLDGAIESGGRAAREVASELGMGRDTPTLGERESRHSD